jgi:energy-coupling factor transporter ATP-binding protein EcfA2
MRKRIGVMLQGNGLLTDLTVAENVALPIRTHTNLPDPVIRRLVEMKLHAVGLRAAADLFPRELSGGMARRVALARALAAGSAADDLRRTADRLDPIASGVVMSWCAPQRHLGLTSIVVTHHVHETLPIADHAIVIANGRIVFSGTPAAAATPIRWCAVPRRRTDGPIAFDSRARRARRRPDALRRRHPLARPRGLFSCRYCARRSRPPTSSASWCARSTRSAHDDAHHLVGGAFVGLSVTLLGYRALETYGAANQVSAMLGLGMYRELGPVLTALLFIGRAGSSDCGRTRA